MKIFRPLFVTALLILGSLAVQGRAAESVLEQPSPADLERGFTILRRVQEQSRGTKYLSRDFLLVELAPYDPDRALELAQLDGKVSDDDLALIIAALGSHDPARAAQWAPARLRQIQDGKRRLMALFGWIPIFVATQPDLAAQTLQEVRVALKPKAATADEVFSLIFAGQLASNLHQPDAAAYFERAVDEAKALEKKQGEKLLPGLIEAVIEGIALSDPALAERAALSLPVGVRVAALTRAASFAALHDVPAALRILERIDTEPEPPTPLPDAQGVVRGPRPNQRRDYAFGLAATAILPKLGKTDPAAALALARRVKEPHRRQALALAAEFQAKDVALGLLREATQIAETQEAEFDKVAVLSRLAGQAYDLDPPTGKQLFEQARQRLQKAQADGPQWDVRDSASFAFYTARIAPEASRARLEADFKRLSGEKDQKAAAWNLARVAQAMSAVDVERALKMARSISDEFFRFDSQRKIAQYVLAPASVRRTLDFDRWGATDNWRPGTPTGW